ncbi:MAG: carbohydrate ABC transporter permease [Anaerolineae bacterium]|nr:carbohydrate ABC transporter permease [Anaerolineae bacterium]
MTTLRLPRQERRKSLSEIQDTRGDRVFMAINLIFLLAILIIILYPLIYTLSASFSAPSAVITGKVTLFPVDFTLVGYQKIFEYPTLIKGMLNSLFYTVVGSSISVVLTLLAAYPLTRKDLPGRRFLTILFFFPMLFSGGLIPFYLVVRDLGMVNTRWALIIPTALSVWNLIITISFLRASIPDELWEAAQLDGCSDIGYLLRIVLPLAKSILAVLFLVYAVAQWNQYFLSLVTQTNPDLAPLQIVLRNILILNKIDLGMLADVQRMADQQALQEQLKFSSIVVASVPVLMLYPFVQRYFVQGLTIGAIKG